MKKWEVEEKDRQARLIKLEADSAERLCLSEEQKETESLSKDLNKKQSTVLQSLQKLDNSTDPEAYLLNFELSLTEGNFPADVWTTILQKFVTGRLLKAKGSPFPNHKRNKQTGYESEGSEGPHHEMFNKVLTVYYSSEVCHTLCGKEYSSIHKMVDEMEAAWELRYPMEHTRMHRTSANSTTHPRRHQWSRHQDQTSSERAGGYPDKSKGGDRPAGLS